jgi:glyoxylase-like metal-dependent hydrolase (beta-lactamase superfamily II)
MDESLERAPANRTAGAFFGEIYMNKILWRAAFTVLLLTKILAAAAQVPPLDRERELQHIGGDLYRFQNLPHYSMVLVTSDGVILSDPINTEAATWLKRELASRFGMSVRYVLYSHHHFDHASGGDVFAETATFVGHENMVANLDKMKNDKRYTEVRPPDVTFSDRTTVYLGGKTVELIHAVPSHSDDSVIMIFSNERVAHGVDWINIKRLPLSRHAMPITDWIKTINQLETLDFDVFAPGHGVVGSKDDVRDYHMYLNTLLSEVSKGIAAGDSVEKIQEWLTLDEYSDWAYFSEWREENILRAYEHLSAADALQDH